MSFIDRINACNRWNPDNFRPLYCDGAVVGWLRPAFIEKLCRWPDVFEECAEGLKVHPRLEGFATRTQALARVLDGLLQAGDLEYQLGELYPVGAGSRDEAAFLLDRAAAAHFGIRAYGQHVNGYVREGDSLKMWIGRRSLDRRNYPGRLDNLAAGGLPHGLTPRENLLKECHEEAGIGPELAAQAVAVGELRYCRETAKGLKPDVIYCYDLELPADFQPECTDGEMSDYYLWPLEEVIEIVRDSEEFKPNCSLVIMDFLIRHGYIGKDEPAICRLREGLLARLP